MLEMYYSLDPMQKVFWGCAVISTAVFAVQLILLFIGIDSEASVDVSFDGDTTDVGGGFTLFSIKNLVNFLVGFGWAGVCFENMIASPVLLTVVAFAVGALFVVMFFVIYSQTRKLENNGAFKISDTKGKSADVYLRIPAKCAGSGQIQVSVNGSVHEIDALTDGDEIATGTKVKVVCVVDDTTVKVEKV